jgi:uncharacterized metal-binding protein YceD (DUF177 family)
LTGQRTSELVVSLPIVTIAAIPPSGLRTFVGDWARLAASEGAEGVVQSLDGRIELIRRGPHILARGEMSVVVRTPCARCGELLDHPFGGPFACVYSPLSAIPERAEDDDGGPDVPSEFAGEAEDVGEYVGDALDLNQVVREFCALERPLRVVCADLAPEQDEACLARWKVRAGPQPVESASPFSALKNLKPSR